MSKLRNLLMWLKLAQEAGHKTVQDMLMWIDRRTLEEDFDNCCRELEAHPTIAPFTPIDAAIEEVMMDDDDLIQETE